MDLLKIGPGEIIAKQENNTLWYKGPLKAYFGNLYLTNERLLFKKAVDPGLGFILRYLIKSFDEILLHDTPLSDISAVEQSAVGTNKNVILVTLKNGIVYTYAVSAPPTTWIATINAARRV